MYKYLCHRFSNLYILIIGLYVSLRKEISVEIWYIFILTRHDLVLVPWYLPKWYGNGSSSLSNQTTCIIICAAVLRICIHYNKIGRNYSRESTTLIAESTWRLGLLWPINSNKTELGAARSPHPPPSEGGGECWDRDGTPAQYRVSFTDIIYQLRLPVEGCWGTLSSRKNSGYTFPTETLGTA